jgi:hypothetical protein
MTELILDGKYDANHKKVAPVKIELSRPYVDVRSS